MSFQLLGNVNWFELNPINASWRALGDLGKNAMSFFSYYSIPFNLLIEIIGILELDMARIFGVDDVAWP